MPLEYDIDLDAELGQADNEDVIDLDAEFAAPVKREEPKVEKRNTFGRMFGDVIGGAKQGAESLVPFTANDPNSPLTLPNAGVIGKIGGLASGTARGLLTFGAGTIATANPLGGVGAVVADKANTILTDDPEEGGGLPAFTEHPYRTATDLAVTGAAAALPLKVPYGPGLGKLALGVGTDAIAGGGVAAADEYRRTGKVSGRGVAEGAIVGAGIPLGARLGHGLLKPKPIDPMAKWTDEPTITPEREAELQSTLEREPRFVGNEGEAVFDLDAEYPLVKREASVPAVRENAPPQLPGDPTGRESNEITATIKLNTDEVVANKFDNRGDEELNKQSNIPTDEPDIIDLDAELAETPKPQTGGTNFKDFVTAKGYDYSKFNAKNPDYNNLFAEFNAAKQKPEAITPAIKSQDEAIAAPATTPQVDKPVGDNTAGDVELNSLADVVNRLENTVEYSPREAIDHAEGLIADGKAPEELQEYIDRYRQERQENRDTWGERGDNEHEQAALDEIYRIAKEATPANAKQHNVAQKPPTSEVSPEFSDLLSKFRHGDDAAREAVWVKLAMTFQQGDEAAFNQARRVKRGEAPIESLDPFISATQPPKQATPQSAVEGQVIQSNGGGGTTPPKLTNEFNPVVHRPYDNLDELDGLVDKLKKGEISEADYDAASQSIAARAGKPRVFYHGTPKAGFSPDKFKIGREGAVFFTPDPNEASGFANKDSIHDNVGIYPVHLSMQNPFKAHIDDYSGHNRVAEIIADAKAAGHDSAIIDGIAESSLNGEPVIVKQYAVFDPKQIRSAIGGKEQAGSVGGGGADVPPKSASAVAEEPPMRLIKAAKQAPKNTAKWPKEEGVVFKPYGKDGAGFYVPETALETASAAPEKVVAQAKKLPKLGQLGRTTKSANTAAKIISTNGAEKPAAVESPILNEKPDKTGFTPTQKAVIVDSIKAKFPELVQEGARAEAAGYDKTAFARSRNAFNRPDPIKRKLTIDVPGDGTIEVRDSWQAEFIHRAMVGEHIDPRIPTERPTYMDQKGGFKKLGPLGNKSKGFIGFGKTPAKPLTAAESKVASHIAYEQSPLRKGSLVKGADKLERAIFDDELAFRNLTEKANTTRKGLGLGPLRPSESPETTFRNLHGMHGVLHGALEYGIRDFNTNKLVTPGLREIMKPIKGDLERLRVYAISKRAAELGGRTNSEGNPIATGLDPVAAQQAVKHIEVYHPKHVEAFNKLKEFQDAVMQYSVDAGLYTPEQAAVMREANREYIPYKRLLESDELGDEFSKALGKGISGVRELYHRIEGSERKIFDPLQSVVENTMHTLAAAKKNEAMLSLANLKDLPGFDELVKPAKPGTKDAVRIKNGGKIEHYVLDPDLRKAVQEAGSDAMGLVGKILSAPANLLRAGTVLQPAFTSANVLRDNVQAGVISRTGMVPFEPIIRGILSRFDKRLGSSELYKEWQQSGGSNSLEAGYFHDQAELKRLVAGEKATAKDKAIMGLGAITDLIQSAAKHSEELTRLGEFQKSRSKGLKSGMGEKDAAYNAAFQSRDLMDFAMGGTETRRFKGPAAFFGSQLAGTLREARAFRESPAKTTAKALAYVTAPTLMLYAANRNDENYWKQPQWLRDTAWLIPRGNGKFIPIPKPPGIIGYGFTVPFERALAFLDKHDKKALDGVFSGAVATVVPNPAPTVARWPVENVANFSFFRGQPIEGEGLRRLPADMRADETTSLLAKQIVAGVKAMGLSISPKMVDYDLRSSFGTLGRYAIDQGIDRMISAKTGEPAPNTRNTLFKRFTTGDASDRSSEVITRFYDRLTTMRQENERKKAGGKPEVDLRQLDRMERAAEKLSDLRKKMKTATTQEAKDQLYQYMEKWAMPYANIPRVN